MERWRAPGYGQIVRASATASGRLSVLFGDATWVELDGNRLLPPATLHPVWSDLKVDDYGDFLVVLTTLAKILEVMACSFDDLESTQQASSADDVPAHSNS